MAPATIPTTEPTQAVAGLTWRWDRALVDYTPAAGWTLKYAFAGPGKLALTGVADASNSGYELTASAATTASLPKGLYTWTAYVESGAEKYVVGSGTLSVLPNPLTAAAGELRMYAEQALEFVEAALLRRYQVDQSQYTIEQRQTVREELTALERARSRLLAEIDAKKNAGAFGRRVAFTPRSYR